MRTPLDSQSGYRPILPHEPGYYQFDSLMDAAIVTRQLDPYRPRPQSLVDNPYVPTMGCLERTTVDAHAHVERQVSPDGGDDVDHGDDQHDIPQTDSADIAQPQLEDIAQSKSEDIA
jgi:hypothetical protein